MSCKDLRNRVAKAKMRSNEEGKEAQKIDIPKNI